MSKENDTNTRNASDTSDKFVSGNSTGFVFGEVRGADFHTQIPTIVTDGQSDEKRDFDRELQRIGSPAAILTIGPPEVPTEYQVCSRYLKSSTTTLENLLLITWAQSPKKRWIQCRSHLEEVPEQVVIINVGDASGVRWSEQIPFDHNQSVNIETVNNSHDLTRVGILISQTLSGWEDTAHRTGVCFNSLTGMLRFIDDVKRVFHFLKVLTNRLKLAGASANFHLQLEEIADDTVEPLQPIFDAIITYDESGNIRLLRKNGISVI